MSLGHPSSIFGAWASGEPACGREEGQRKQSCGLGAWREIAPRSLFAAKTVYLQVCVFHGNGDRQRKNALVKHFHEFMLFIWSVTALQRGLWGLAWSGTQAGLLFKIPSHLVTGLLVPHGERQPSRTTATLGLQGLGQVHMLTPHTFRLIFIKINKYRKRQ